MTFSIKNKNSLFILIIIFIVLLMIINFAWFWLNNLKKIDSISDDSDEALLPPPFLDTELSEEQKSAVQKEKFERTKSVLDRLRLVENNSESVSTSSAEYLLSDELSAEEIFKEKINQVGNRLDLIRRIDQTAETDESPPPPFLEQ